MLLAFGCDPNATEFKKVLMSKASELGHEVVDYGSEDPVYANTAFDVATDVVAGKADRGILVCGTGIGVSISANKVKGAYCALVGDIYQAERAVLSNNANLIAMGAQVMGTKVAARLLEEYLSHTFDPNSRSRDKVARICEYEEQQA